MVDTTRMTTTSTRSTDAAAPLAWGRSSAFGIVAAGIGAGGHAVVTGGDVSWLVFAIASVLLAAYARVFADERASWWHLAVGIVLAQVLVHLSCELTQPLPAHHLGQHATHASGVPWAMLLTHAVATILGLVVLLRLEAAAWRQVATAVTRIMRLLTACIFGTHHARTLVATRVVEVVEPCSRRRRWATASTGRRGPPVPSPT